MNQKTEKIPGTTGAEKENPPAQATKLSTSTSTTSTTSSTEANNTSKDAPDAGTTSTSTSIASTASHEASTAAGPVTTVTATAAGPVTTSTASGPVTTGTAAGPAGTSGPVTPITPVTPVDTANKTITTETTTTHETTTQKEEHAPPTSDSHHHQLPNDPAVWNGNGKPITGQKFGESALSVADPLVGIGDPDKYNKYKYGAIDTFHAKNTDHKATVDGLQIAEVADTNHKNFLDENTEEFENILMWIQESAKISPSHAPPKLLLEILKERLVLQENAIKAQMSEEAKLTGGHK